MFFIMGITQGRKDFDYNQMMVCAHCGSYGRYQVYMTYMCLSLFFIPCLKFSCAGDWETDRKGRKDRNPAGTSDTGTGGIQKQSQKMRKLWI